MKTAHEVTGKNVQNLSSIKSLPTMMHQHFIFKNLADKELYKLSQTSREMSFYCQAVLKEREAKKLLSHEVKGEEEQTLAMIRANPKLLLHASKAIDYSERFYNNYTPFQAALPLCRLLSMLVSNS